MRTTILTAGIALWTAAALGCGDGTTAPGVDGDAARLRVVHAVVAVSSVDVVVDGAVIIADLSAGEASPFVGVPAGDRLVALVPSGGPLSAGSGVSINFALDDSVTVITVDSSSIINPWVLSDTGAMVPAGKSKLRAVHMAEQGPNIDIWRTQPDFNAPYTFQFPFHYQEASPYVQSDPGVWRVLVSTLARDGMGVPVMTDTLLDTGPIEVPDGESRTAVILDDSPHGLGYLILKP
jgi:Domain of unknown function (DUF4397)